MRRSPVLFVALVVALVALLLAILVLASRSFTSSEPPERNSTDPADQTHPQQRQDAKPAHDATARQHVRTNESPAWSIIGHCRTNVWATPPNLAIEGVAVTVKLVLGRVAHTVGTAISAADGSFAVDVAAIRDFTPTQRRLGILQIHGDHAEWSSNDPDYLEPAPIDNQATWTRRADLQLARGTVVTGRLVDEQGRAVLDARFGEVEEPHAAEMSSSTFVAPDGSVRIAVDSAAMLRAVSETAGVSDTITIETGEHRRVELGDIVLRRRSVFRGTAQYADGSPARWMRIEIFGDEDRATGRGQADVLTDAHGRFEAVAMDSEQDSWIVHFDENGDEHETTTVSGLGPHMLIVRSPRIVFRARRAHPPLDDYVVHVIRWRGVPPVEDLNDHFSTFRNTLGFFTRTGDRWLLAMNAAGLGLTEHEVQFPPDRWETVIDLGPTELQHPAQLHVVARDSNGSRLPALVSLWRAPHRTYVAHAQAIPNHEPLHVAPGRYFAKIEFAPPRSRVHRGDIAMLFPCERELALEAGHNSVEVELVPAGKFHLRIKDEPDPPDVDGGTARLIDPRGREFDQQIEIERIGDGWLRAKPRWYERTNGMLLPGRYEIEIQASNGDPIRESFEIVAGEEHNIEIRV